MEVDERGNFHIVNMGQRLFYYTSLRDLVWDCESLQTLYPDFPKEEAFQ